MKGTLCAVLFSIGCQAGELPGVIAPPGPATPMQLATSAPPLQQPRDAVAPFTLTASDGSGLMVTRVEAKAVVQGPLAFTELHLYFHNPEPRVREGTFAITLPASASVSRFAMELDGRMQEAEVVEKMAARRIYDDFLHRKQDPALLEQAAGNQFSAKVFPIAPNADKHLVVSYSQLLRSDSYVLPLRGLPKVERVDVTLAATLVDGSLLPQTLVQRAWQPDRDFVAALPPTPAAVAAPGVVVAAVPISAPNAAPAPVTELTLLVDTSASRALGFARYVASVHELVGALATKYGATLPVQVLAFDQDTQAIYDGPASGYTDANDRALLARGAAGASDLAQAVASLRAPHRRIVVITDGVLTAGADTPALTAAIAKLRAERLDVVLAGGIRDERTAAALARAGLPRSGDVLDLDRGPADVANALGAPVLADVPVRVPGATWSWPKTVPALRAGTTLMVFARMPSSTQTLAVDVGAERHTLSLAAATPALVERTVASAEIDEREATLAATQDTAMAATIRADIAQRSIKNRVISSQTAMLVLETETDYARYKLDRNALADVLVVGPRGLEQQHHAAAIATAPAPTPSPAPSPQLARAQSLEEARNAGVLGNVAEDTGTFASLTGTADISTGFDDPNVYGGLLGNEEGEESGGYGFGRSGFGPGGGGTGWGTIGTGRYGTVGRGSGTGSGYGVGGGRGGMRGRSASAPAVSLSQPTVAGSLDKAIIRRYIKRNIQRITYCYELELQRNPLLSGTVISQFTLSERGAVTSVTASGMSPAVSSCVANVIRGIEFPAPGSPVRVTYPLRFRPSGETRNAVDAGFPVAPAPAPEPERRTGPAITGKLADVMDAIHAGATAKALELASAWHTEAPGDVLALIGYGEALEATHDVPRAARIYGSIIDLFPGRADMRRFAGERLERLAPARDLVIDTYRRAVADRPDHATVHRLLAYALVRRGDYAGAFAAILAGVDQKYPGGRFRGADRVLAEDAGMIGAAYLAHGGPVSTVTTELAKRSLELATGPSTRFIMYWETDGNDVDFHIRDGKGGHAWYQSMNLPSGGSLYADVTTGYGPECFAIPGTPSAGPYQLSINYFSQGPMGYGMGLLQAQRFDGKSFTFDDRPFVIMVDHAFVDLGTYP